MKTKQKLKELRKKRKKVIWKLTAISLTDEGLKQLKSDERTVWGFRAPFSKEEYDEYMDKPMRGGSRREDKGTPYSTYEKYLDYYAKAPNMLQPFGKKIDGKWMMYQDYHLSPNRGYFDTPEDFEKYYVDQEIHPYSDLLEGNYYQRFILTPTYVNVLDGNIWWAKEQRFYELKDQKITKVEPWVGFSNIIH